MVSDLDHQAFESGAKKRQGGELADLIICLNLFTDVRLYIMP